MTYSEDSDMVARTVTQHMLLSAPSTVKLGPHTASSTSKEVRLIDFA